MLTQLEGANIIHWPLHEEGSSQCFLICLDTSKCQPHTNEVCRSPTLICWRHFIHHLWHTSEQECHRGGLHRTHSGETTDIYPTTTRLQWISETLEAASATKPDSQEHEVDTPVTELMIVLIKFSLAADPCLNKEPLENTHLPCTQQDQLSSIFNMSKFFFGILLPPSLHCFSSSWAHCPCPQVCSCAWQQATAPPVAPSCSILVGPQ